MNADTWRALARGTAMGLMMAGLAVAGGQYSAQDLLFSPLFMFGWMTGLEYWWRRRRRTRGPVPTASTAATTRGTPTRASMAVAVVFGAALMFGLLAWRGQLRPQAYVIVPVTMLLTLGAALAFERGARRRDAVEAVSP